MKNYNFNSKRALDMCPMMKIYNKDTETPYFLYKTPYSFLLNYIKKGSPATANIITPGYINCSTNASRSVTSLYALTRNYFPNMTYYMFYKSLLRVLYKLNYYLWYCCTTYKIVIKSSTYISSCENSNDEYYQLDDDQFYSDIRVIMNDHELEIDEEGDDWYIDELSFTNLMSDLTYVYNRNKKLLKNA